MSSQFFDNYRKYVARKWIDNIREVINGEYDEVKLETHANLMGLTYQDLKSRITNGDIPAAYILAKDPTKQNIQEMYQAEYINSAVGYEAVKILPKKNKIKFSENGYKTKTTDAIITINGEEYYCGMKLIMSSGGAQDNQRSDIQKYLAIGANTADKKVIALIDDTDPKPCEYYMNPVKDRNKAFVFTSDSLIERLI